MVDFLPFSTLNMLSHSLLACTAAVAKLHQSCPTLCDPIDGSPPDSPVPGILQARTLEWVARPAQFMLKNLLALWVLVCNKYFFFLLLLLGFSLTLNFYHFNYNLGCVWLFGFNLFGTLCFLDLDVYLLSHFMEIFSHYFLK